jgi:hypothetical protein
MDDAELLKQICHVLRQAAGLPPVENPLDWDVSPKELKLPWVGHYAGLILAHRGDAPDSQKRPDAVASELEKIGRKARELWRLVEALDEPAKFALTYAGGPVASAYNEALKTVDHPEELGPVFFAEDYMPHEEAWEWDVELALDALWHLQSASSVVERELRADAAERLAARASGDARGRKTDLSKRNVAVAIANYLRAATGKPPTIWKSDVPTGAFAVALSKIFQLLGFTKAIDRAAEHAIQEVSATSHEFASNEWVQSEPARIRERLLAEADFDGFGFNYAPPGNDAG